MRTIFKKIIPKILKFEADLVVRKYKPKIILITGSIGKTSSKDAIYTVLSEIAYVRKSNKSYNSQIGLPLTILGLSNGLVFQNLTVSQGSGLNSNDTFISVKSTNEYLSVLTGITVADITSADFNII